MGDQTIKFVRQVFTNLSTIGEVIVDGAHQCWYLEPACRRDPNNPNQVICIPEGTYEVVMYDSPKARERPWGPTFNYQVPLMLKVPGHSYVECHPGNTPSDTLDCFCPGYTKDINMVGNSVEAWKDLVSIIIKKLVIAPTFFEVMGGLV